MDLTPEARDIGRENYYDALGFTRREFLQGLIATGVVAGGGLGAAYFGYEMVSDPVRIGVIGTGDEGNVLIGGCNPDYVAIKAIADIRPSSIHRAFYGDWASPAAKAARPGMIKKCFNEDEAVAKKEVKVYTYYQDLLADDDIEAVIIALPLHLHAQVAYEAMAAGKHVLTEKLMAHNVAQCKVISQMAARENLHLATGHQRHYSVLYDNAVSLLQSGLLGELHHIRAQWHRGNLPGSDSWAQPIPGGEKIIGSSDKVDKIADAIKSLRSRVASERDPKAKAEYVAKLAQWEAWDQDKNVNAKNFSYEDRELPNGYTRTALEELIRWRLWDRTGGGLMAELGSHQLDAASIFISSLRADGKKAHPLTVHAVGGRHIFPYDRDAEDHVYCTFEFPGPGYDPKAGATPQQQFGYYDKVLKYPDKNAGIPRYEDNNNKKIVVTYSSINGNGFGGYGEVVMGTKGTMILEREKDVYIYTNSDSSTRVGASASKGGPVLDTQASGATGPVAKVASGPVSRGYQEEIEHWAYCIRNNPGGKNASSEAFAEGPQPRCKPVVAMGDAVIALTAAHAMKQKGGGYVQFDEAWFEVENPATPDGSDVAKEEAIMKKVMEAGPSRLETAE